MRDQALPGAEPGETEAFIAAARAADPRVDAAERAREAGAATPRPWPDNAWPAPEQLAAWLRSCTEAEAVEWCSGRLTMAQEQHDSLLYWFMHRPDEFLDRVAVIREWSIGRSVELDELREALKRELEAIR